mmetsp:Transcript_7932/g.25936  ORF Transcript_7932/g.25936 Transcript_7932/m.25936 type:complete len:313 (+) Transcript_7932:11-949(+)
MGRLCYRPVLLAACLLGAALDGGDAVAERERDALRLGPDSDVAGKLPIGVVLALHGDVDQRVLAEDGLGVQVGGQEGARAPQRRGRRQAAHVRAGDDVVEEVGQLRDGRRDGHLVLPLEFCPHVPKRLVAAGSRADVVHDVEVDVVQIDVVLLRRRRLFIHDGAEDVASLCRGDFDVGADGLLVQRPERERLRPLHELEVAHRRQLDCEVGQRRRRAVRDEDLQHDVVVVHRHDRFRVDRVREAGELVHVRKAHAEGVAAFADRLLQVARVAQIRLDARSARRLQLPPGDAAVGLRARGEALAVGLVRLQCL